MAIYYSIRSYCMYVYREIQFSVTYNIIRKINFRKKLGAAHTHYVCTLHEMFI